MKIAVLMGGSSGERDVSLNSGAAIAEGLRAKYDDVTAYDVQWEQENTLFEVIETIRRDGTDVVFLGLHGGLGENGGIQGILEAAGLTYTCSGITASAIAMDKDISKKLFVQHAIPTAAWIAGTAGEIDFPEVETAIGYPCIVKPVDQGSTIGLSLVHNLQELRTATESAWEIADRIMIEVYLTGIELTVPVLGGKALPVIEVRPSHELYDYECKYTPGKTEYFVPAPIDEALASEVQALACNVFNIMGLRDIARVDFRLDSNGKPFCFEANTLPGMTKTSLVPKSAKAAGIDFPDLVSRIVEMAYSRKG